MQEFIVNVYVSLIRLRRNNYQDFALPLYPSQSGTRHNIQASLMFCARLQRLCISLSCTRQFESKLSLRSFAKTLYPKAVPLTPNLIYWKQYKVYIT